MTKIKPFEHQQRAIDLFGSTDQILAHEMGLGKTLTSAFIGKGFKCIVACPAKLKKSWVAELKKIEEESVQVIETSKDEIESKNWTIVSYDILPKIIDKLLSENYDKLFLDESHYIKGKFRVLKNGNINGIKRAGASVQLAESIPHVILTTGTPIMNKPIELWNQLLAVKSPITREMTRMEFSKRYCGGMLKTMGRFRFWWEGGASHLDELRDKIAGSIDVVKKADVLDLPEKVYTRKIVELSPDETREYNGAWKEYLAEIAKNPEMSERKIEDILDAQDLVEGQKLEQIASVAKAKQVIDDLQNLGPGDTLVIFTQWVETLRIINEAIDDMIKKQKKEQSEWVISYSTIQQDGSVEKFQKGDVQIFTSNIVAGGTGLNLQERCNNVWIVDENWNPGINKQAEDRIHRIGQEKSAFITYYEAFGTIDEIKRDANIRKRKVADKLLSTPKGKKDTCK